MDMEYTYHGVQETEDCLKELGLQFVRLRDAHWRVSLKRGDESFMIIASWRQEGDKIHASFGLSVNLATVFKTAAEYVLMPRSLRAIFTFWKICNNWKCTV
ncbi:hypothetical protein FACS1894211_09870 [Clostridia bacterium]|nr:hypothetical protein FACS1894211_09870 [Clostridia bacterium]